MSFVFNPTDGYRNTVSFPTTPGGEATFRDQMMSLLDQIRDYINGSLSSDINNKVTKAEGNSAPNNNLEDITETGFYAVDSGTTNTPGLGGSGSTVIATAYNSLNIELLYLGRTGDLIYSKRKSAGVWQPWIELWHAGNNAASLSSSGYQKLASGLIMQWGAASTVQPSTATPITFPVSFPTAIARMVNATVETTAAGENAIVANRTATGFNVYHNGSAARTILWVAFGY